MQADGGRRGRLRTAERHELAREVDGACAGGVDLADFFLQWIVRRQLLRDHIRAALDDVNQVVEVVRDRGREACDGVHLASHAQLARQVQLLALHLLAISFEHAVRVECESRHRHHADQRHESAHRDGLRVELVGELQRRVQNGQCHRAKQQAVSDAQRASSRHRLVEHTQFRGKRHMPRTDRHHDERRRRQPDKIEPGAGRNLKGALIRREFEGVADERDQHANGQPGVDQRPPHGPGVAAIGQEARQDDDVEAQEEIEGRRVRVVAVGKRRGRDGDEVGKKEAGEDDDAERAELAFTTAALAR